jgi:hypothetical protein|tara:strand:+ start:218 stop:418 length:201 start_codon:yes stop_codon:yes gene_type:complete
VKNADEVAAFSDTVLNGSEKWTVQKMAINDEVIAFFGNLKFGWFRFQVCAYRMYSVTAATVVSKAQ